MALAVIGGIFGGSEDVQVTNTDIRNEIKTQIGTKIQNITENMNNVISNSFTSFYLLE